MAEEDRNTKVRKSYHEATNRLRAKHMDEFRELQKDVAKELGIEYTPRPTKEEKARQQLLDLLRDNPSLETEVVEKVKQQLSEGEQGGKPAVAEVPQSDTA